MTAVIQAAKESAHVFPLAALRQFAEKPHRGHHAPSSTFRPGALLAISNTATALPVCLYDSGIRSCCSGKERDGETGLDYFESRYYSSVQGRFTSPDEFKGGFLDAFTGQSAFQPGPLPYADITDPQTLNKFVYVRNSPLRYVDPDGHNLNDVVKDGLDFVSGVGRGIAASESLGAVGAPSSSDSLANRLGQVVGTVAAGVAGAGASVAGGGVIIATEGAAAPLAAPGALAGAGVAIGAAKNVGAILTTPMQMGALDKPPTGKGSVPPDQRDPKRTLTDSQKAKKLSEQGGNCADCGKPITGEKGIAHHDPVRHADGGKDMKIVHEACHDSLHSCK